ncbi:MAG: hypothetical protein ACOX4R_08080 [Lentihominibacter sp.]|jgi:hypothetical protein
MSTSIENLRRLAERDVKDHTAIFDLYVTLGRDIDYLSIKFGMNPDDVINLLEGYGEKLRTADEFGIAPDYSGKGRFNKLSRLLIEEYVEHFYPGIATNPANDWICLEEYLDRMHKGWRKQLTEDAKAVKEAKSGRKVRNKFKLY